MPVPLSTQSRASLPWGLGLISSKFRGGGGGGSGAWELGCWAAAVAPNCSEAHGLVRAPAGTDIKQMGSDALSGEGRLK